METYFSRGHEPRAYLTHDDTELEGRAPSDASTPEIAIENARKTIHKILVEDRRRIRSSALPELEPQVPEDFWEPQPRQDWAQGQMGAVVRARMAVGRLFGGRIDARHVFWPVIFALVFWQPAVVLLMLFVTFCLVLLGHVIFGVSRMARLRSLALGLLPARWLP
jgi:hypothetical protein